MNNENSAVLKVDELAHMLSISRNTAYELVRSGKIRSVKIGRTYRIPRSAVEDYLNVSCQTENPCKEKAR